LECWPEKNSRPLPAARTMCSRAGPRTALSTAQRQPAGPCFPAAHTAHREFRGRRASIGDHRHAELIRPPGPVSKTFVSGSNRTRSLTGPVRQQLARRPPRFSHCPSKLTPTSARGSEIVRRRGTAHEGQACSRSNTGGKRQRPIHRAGTCWEPTRPTKSSAPRNGGRRRNRSSVARRRAVGTRRGLLAVADNGLR